MAFATAGSLVIRPAVPGDAADLQALYADSIVGADWLPDAVRHSPVFSDVSQGEVIHVAASAEGQIVGLVSVQAADPFIHHLFIRADSRSAGVGAMLLNSLKAWLPMPWHLKCVRRNTGALAFYAGAGWLEVGSGASADGEYLLLSYDCAPASR